ncbi:MAG: GNAT family N-acetyltransferase [Candidatus Tectomicrobia bacterium]|nr:GNAT family N-acetyltransferase [Candidatus Tectomicrobia bacterium]
MLDPTKIHFQKLCMADLHLIEKWFNTDFVMQWFSKRRWSYGEVVEKYSPRIQGQEPTDGFVILYDDTPIGYIQTYKIKDYPDYSKYV